MDASFTSAVSVPSFVSVGSVPSATIPENEEKVKEKYQARGETDATVALFAPQALDLVQKLPVLIGSWVLVKTQVPDKFASARGWTKTWAEVRGGVLLYSSTGKCGPSDRSSPADWSAFDLVYYTATSRRQRTLVLKRPDQGVTIHIRVHNDMEFARWQTLLQGTAQQFTLNYSDFDVLHTLGKGAYGKVFMAIRKSSGERLAMKVIEKSVIEDDEYLFKRVVDERAVLEKVGYHPYVLRLFYAFESAQRLFFFTEFLSEGDLFGYLGKRRRPLNEMATKALMAELVLALEHVHSVDVVYRDLKPENILLDAEGHIRLADFGLAKILAGDFRRTDSICGTREYFAPEMLTGDYGPSVDLWSLGVFMYHILTGSTPFESEDPEEILEKVQYAPILMPSFLSLDARKLLKDLLNRNPKKRLGFRGIHEIREHDFFKGVDFGDVLEKRTEGIFAYEESHGARGNVQMSRRRKQQQLPTVAQGKKGGGEEQAFHSIAGFSYSYKTLEQEGTSSADAISVGRRTRRSSTGRARAGVSGLLFRR